MAPAAGVRAVLSRICLMIGGLSAGQSIFSNATDIHESKTELQRNQSVSAIVQSPDDPQRIAGKKDPKPPVPLEFALRCDEPSASGRHHHRRPLDEINPVHENARCNPDTREVQETSCIRD